MPDNLFTQTHVANSWSEHVWSWGPSVANLWKVWFDREDNFNSLMDNVEIQVGQAWHQAPGAITNADMITVGRGVYAGGKPGMAPGQYRIEMYLYAVLASPLVLSFDLTTLNAPANANAKALITNKELIRINQDVDAVMASKISGPRPMGRDPYAQRRVSTRTAVDVWIKPLSDGSFAVALANRDPVAAHVVQLDLSGDTGGDFYSGPLSKKATVRDVGNLKDLGHFVGHFNATVPTMDGLLLRFKFDGVHDREEL